MHPLKHRSEQTHRDLIWLKTRDLLVRQRGDAVRTIRNLLKSLGMKLPAGWSTESFAGKCRRQLAESTELALMEPLLVVIESSTAQIKRIDQEIARLIAERYPGAARLQSVRGVGPITALSFVLIVEDAERFGKNRRAVGNYLGLTPKRDQSGEVDKQLRITKEGPSTLRRLLVSCAHYIMGPFGEPSALREAGERIQALNALYTRLLEISEAADLAFPEDAARYHLPQPPKSGDTPPNDPDPAPEEPAA